MRKKAIYLFIFCTLSFILGPSAKAAEPNMTDYTAYPVFLSQSIKPNIMIILDNSGSMNFNAYGSYPGNGGTVTDAPFEGEPYSDRMALSISQSADDMEERTDISDTPWNNSGDLDLGGFETTTNNAVTGLRFQNLNIPQGATILNAIIAFTAFDADSVATDLSIVGELSEDAAEFSTTTTDDIFLRTETTASVSWKSLPAWTAGNTYSTPDLASIVQEIVDQTGWQSGNAIAFKISGTGKRDAQAFNHSAANAPKLYIIYDNPNPKRYYGYFNPDYFYTYGSNKFDHAYKKIKYIGSPVSGGKWSVEDLSGTAATLSDTDIVTKKLWDGNWLNWLSMRRIDVLRKVLMGGLATSRTGGGNQVNYGETPQQSYRTFIKWFDTSNGSAVSPYDGNYSFGMSGGYIYVDDDSDPFSSAIEKLDIKVQKNVNYEPEDFHNYDSGDNLAGILQKVGDKARWGNTWFNTGTGSNESGGTVVSTIGTNMVTLVTDLQNTGCDTYTPLAETYYVATQYFKQEDPESGLDYPNNAVPNSNTGDDPWYNNGYVDCAKSFVILLTDGASTKDAKIPSSLKDFDGDGDKTACDESAETNCDYPGGGTDYLDDIALYARTTDLRSDLDEEQNIILYTVYAFGDDENARSLLKDAARNGGFKDRDGDDKPDGTYTDPPEDRLEWDEDGDAIPDTFFEASDGYELERQLLKAITDILQRAAAGSAASVLATNTEGEGTMVQAYFRPSVTNGTEDANWLGYLQSLWVDPWGNLREDTNGNNKLDLWNSTSTSTRVDADKIISYVVTNTDTMVDQYTKHYMYNPDNGESDECNLSDCSTTADTVTLETIIPIFEAGEILANRDPNERRIFTYIDKDADGVVDDGTYNGFDVSGEVITFDTGTASEIKPYLGVLDNTAWSYLGSTHDDRATNLVDYIRGTDIADLRNRTLNTITWKLGDIVHSTPISVAKASENLHIIYSDESYQTYYDSVKNRETVIYVGANDGMLHAFTSWRYDKNSGEFKDPYPSDSASDTTFIPGEEIGDELWSFIPQSLLPHLKWLADPDYTHTYYVDLRPKVFDAKIDRNGDGSVEWGTFLLCGLNMGGKYIWSEGDYGSGLETRDFHPSYFMLDITEPRNPRLLWERTYDDLSMSKSVPSIVKVDDTWFAVFGSGPTDYEGNSTQSAYFYVVDLQTGKPYQNSGNDWLFGPLENKAFINSPVSLDKNLNYSVDGIYFGESYLSGSWKGKAYKITIPCITCDWDPTFNPSTDTVDYDENPANWTLSALFSENALPPITAPMALSVDKKDNAWVYFGSGRYIGQNDKTTTTQNYLYGVKDPFFNEDQTSYYLNFSSSKTLSGNDLFDADNITITTAGRALSGASLYGTNGEWSEVLDDARLKDGWRVSLERPASGPSERSVSKSALLGGIVFTPTFTPNSDICGFGGDSNFYAVYYETGTGYPRQILPINNPSSITLDNVTQDKVEIKLPTKISGAPPPRVGMHAGRQSGAKAYLQQSTGQVVDLSVDTAFNIKSGLINWKEE